MLYCGFSKCDITPELGMGMPGYFENRINTGVLDNLFAKAVVFESDRVVTALVVLDAIQIDRSDVLDIRRKAQELCGIEAENIFAWATHTHTGGPVDGAMESKRDKKYINFMTSQAAQAIADAYAKRRAAKLGSATGEVKECAYIRRFIRSDGSAVMNPRVGDKDILGTEGEPDETFTVARIEDAQSGKVMGFLSSYGLHLDTVTGTLISADYPGALQAKVSEKYGEDVMSIFFTGPCGNTNHFDMEDITTRDGTTMRFRIAEKLFAEFERLDDKIVCSDCGIDIRGKRILLPLRCADEEQIKWAKDILAGVKNDYYDERFQLEIFAKPLIDISERIDETVEIEIGAVKVGALTVISWPGEVFVEFGRAVREAFPGEDIIIGELSGGSVVCYICTQEAHRRGSYEPMAVSALCLNPDGGDKIVEATLKMLK